MKAVHQNLKEEVLESGHLSAAEWLEFVELKARKYMNSKRVKKMKGVTKEHIYAIILYCDFSALCTAFSETFRLQNVFESMESVKQRHSQFAIFGELLVELVLKFGINGDDDEDEYEKGPFFCGLNCILNVGSFAITLITFSVFTCNRFSSVLHITVSCLHHTPFVHIQFRTAHQLYTFHFGAHIFFLIFCVPHIHSLCSLNYHI